MERNSIASIRLAKVLLAILCVAIVWRAASLPLTRTEAAGWQRVVRPPVRDAVVSPGTWPLLVQGVIAKRAAGIFRLSEFSFRAPAWLGAFLFFLGTYQLGVRQFRGWWYAAAMGAVAAAALFTDCFTFFGGPGLALGLCSLAVAFRRSAGWWLGLGLASTPVYWWAPAMLALALLYSEGFRTGMNRVVIPGTAASFVLLILPLSHGGAPLPRPVAPDASEYALHAAVEVLWREAGNRAVGISASPSARQLLEFYRARYRARNWFIGSAEPTYFLWVEDDGTRPGGHGETVFRQDGVVLAR